MDVIADAGGAAWAAVAPRMMALHAAMAGQRQAAAQGTGGLTDAEAAEVTALSARDEEVRAHEEAHARVGGQYAGSPSYSYTTGPDGRPYAVAGEVPIDVSPVPEDPAATVAKMEVVKAAALAPAEPSAADRQIAALADAQRLQAVVELMAQRQSARIGGTVDTRR